MSMMNKKLQYFSLAFILCILAVASFVGLQRYSVDEAQSNHDGIALRDFSPGSEVQYKIVENGKVIEKSTKVFDKDKSILLPLPPLPESAESRDITYELSISDPSTFFSKKSEAEVLDMILNLNITDSKKRVSLHAKGLEEFSEIQVSKGGNTENLSADWAGLFSAELGNFDDGKISPEEDIIELAFQNAGINGDLNVLGNGKVDVLLVSPFPGSGGSSTAAVQRRWSAALIMMTLELSAVMVKQTEIIGTFFDASIQLDTQRKHQELQARAHKDYHPSESMCRIGTFMRNIATSESRADINKHALNKMLINQYTAVQSSNAAGGPSVNEVGMLDQYEDDFCDPFDNDAALSAICPPAAATAAELNRRNKDIDYTRTLLSKLTLDVDFGGVGSGTLTDDEEDIIALAKNLYFPNVFNAGTAAALELDPRAHYDSRSFAAKMNVAHTSFVNIVGMKSSASIAPDGAANTVVSPLPLPSSPTYYAPSGQASPPHYIGSGVTEDSGALYMKSMLREFGIPDDEIHEYLGERPSYYAQMEVLTKKIFQHPNFYTNLYDKPANVDRIGASIDAITLMNQRDRYESLLRREMLTSVLIEEELAGSVDVVTSNIYEQINTPQRPR